MKRIYLAAALLIATISVARAQSFDLGVNNITLTTGFVSGYNIPVAFSYERGVASFAPNHKLGVGGYVITGGSYTFLAGECNYHFVALEKFDIYGGARLGYRSLNNVTGIHSTVNIGSNYYFAPSWAVNVELDSGLTHLNAGLTFKF